jgi:hypothetical protein
MTLGSFCPFTLLLFLFFRLHRVRGICIDSGVEMPHIRQVVFVPCSDEWRCSFPEWSNAAALFACCCTSFVGSFGFVTQGVVCSL